MSIENHSDEVKKSQQNGDGHDLRSSDSQNAGLEHAGSVVVEFDDDGYQDLHRADIEDIQFEIGGDVSGDSLGAETLFQDEVLHDEPGLELDDNSLDVHDGDVDTALYYIERDITQDLSGIGACFSESAPPIGLILEVE
ncbi:hypothetical protein TCE0_033r09474 [Talaromyces pinophilus]|uniref:Uncharacterized protein n=1 Tax=Talaromyces pinophilus TaxID=128442 RepID=A0A6V8HB16_TALPI|nr:hypothetical protein TCE0_033r09474 [Talaromyces pinophilus]